MQNLKKLRKFCNEYKLKIISMPLVQVKTHILFEKERKGMKIHQS